MTPTLNSDTMLHGYRLTGSGHDDDELIWSQTAAIATAGTVHSKLIWPGQYLCDPDPLYVFMIC